MKKQIRLLALAVIIAIPFSSCKKTDPPVVTTATVTSVTETTASTGGDVTSEGSAVLTARGVCWSTNANPTVVDSRSVEEPGAVGAFVHNLIGLTPGTLYHLKAYATNANGTGYGAEVTFTTSSLVKSIGVVYPDGVERYDFTYDSGTKKVTKIDDYWNADLDKTITYDYSVAGKLRITSGSSTTDYEINAQGMVTKEDWGGGEYAAYTYDADGFLIKIIEHWGGADHLKMQAVITNGNIMKHTTYDDDGVTAKKVKEFTYTVGDNVNNIHQASMVDSNTKPVGNLFGKSSKKLVDFLEYWDPRTTDAKLRTTITYEFDAKNRPSKITR